MSKLNFSRGALIDPTRGARESVATAISTVGNLSDRVLEERMANKELKQDKEKMLLTDAINRDKLAQSQLEHQQDTYLASLEEDRLQSKADREAQEAERKRAEAARKERVITLGGENAFITAQKEYLAESDTSGRLIDKQNEEGFTTSSDSRWDTGFSQVDAKRKRGERGAINQSILENKNGRGALLGGATQIVDRGDILTRQTQYYAENGFEPEEAEARAKIDVANLGENYEKLEEERQEKIDNEVANIEILLERAEQNSPDDGKPASIEDMAVDRARNATGGLSDKIDPEKIRSSFSNLSENDGWFFGLFGEDHQEKARNIVRATTSDEAVKKAQKKYKINPETLNILVGTYVSSRANSAGELEGSKLNDEAKQFVLKEMQDLSTIAKNRNADGTLDIPALRKTLEKHLTPSGEIGGLATEEAAITDRVSRNLDNYSVQGPSSILPDPNNASAANRLSNLGLPNRDIPASASTATRSPSFIPPSRDIPDASPVARMPNVNPTEEVLASSPRLPASASPVRNIVDASSKAYAPRESGNTNKDVIESVQERAINRSVLPEELSTMPLDEKQDRARGIIVDELRNRNGKDPDESYVDVVIENSNPEDLDKILVSGKYFSNRSGLDQLRDFAITEKNALLDVAYLPRRKILDAGKWAAGAIRDSLFDSPSTEEVQQQTADIRKALRETERMPAEERENYIKFIENNGYTSFSEYKKLNR